MIGSYVTIALRILRKYKTYTFINVAGLAIGIASCLLIFLYVQDERSYDRFHEKVDRIYRVVEDRVAEGRVSRLATTYGPLAPALETDFASVEHAVRVLPYPVLVSSDAAHRFQEDRVLFVDSTFFDVFGFAVLKGDASALLGAPFSIVLTTSMARKYFGAEDPVGKILEIRSDEGPRDFAVTGVVADPPSNTHLQFDFLASFSSMRTLYGHWIDDPRNWDHPPLYTYALLSEGSDVSDVEVQMPAFTRRHMGDNRSRTRSLHWEALTSVHLHARRENEWIPASDITYVYVFSLIGLLILAIGCINFMNLATARAATRAREVGVRKVLGARRKQLVWQFLGESILLAILALVLALVLVQFLTPFVNAVSGKSLAPASLLQGWSPVTLLGLVFAVGLSAGSYPAIYLSAFQPAGPSEHAAGASALPAGLRRGLVAFQFVISIGLIIGTTVIGRQLDYLQNKKLGFDKEHVVVIPLRDQEDQFNSAAIKQQLEQIPAVRSVSATSGVPGIQGGLHDFWVYPDHTSRDSLELMTLTVDHDFVETIGLRVIAGRDFSEAFPSDESEAFVINESAARKLGWADPVGKDITLNYYFNGHIRKRGTVIGLVEDFQYHSLRHAIDPTVLHIVPNSYYSDYLTARIDSRDVATTLASMGERWQAFNTARPFEYTFLDDTFDALYRSESRLARLVGYFTALANLIACMGLFGLVAFSVEQRAKEIGVRKVLGASVGSIVLLLTNDVFRLIGVAFAIGAPLGWVVMSYWLDEFVYRIDLSWQVFLVSGLAVLMIASLTAGFHAVKAALSDPVEALRYE